MDPGLETRMMQLFRALAEEGTRAVLVVTHATKNLALADKVVVMGRGGELTFFGPPSEAVAFFGVDDYDGVYGALDARPGVEWRRDFEAARRPPGRAEAEAEADTGEQPVRAGGAAARGGPPRPRVGSQAGVLARRYVTLVARDRRNLAILLGQVVVFGLGIALLFRTGVLDPPGRGRPAEATQLLFLLVITVVWMGLVDGAREIVKERALLDRERSVGVRLGAYLTSKAAVLFPLLALQTALLLLIVFGIRPAGESLQAYAAVFAVLMLTGFVSVALGLLISSVVATEDQATSLLPLGLIPQLLFAGAIASVQDMGQPVRAVADLMPSRWAYAGIGGALDMNDRIAGDQQFARVHRFEPSFFDLSTPAAVTLQLLFVAILLAGVTALLRRRRA
jgi:energy-coupling factor transporter ATP-binding protein EcfA2